MAKCGGRIVLRVSIGQLTLFFILHIQRRLNFLRMQDSITGVGQAGPPGTLPVDAGVGQYWIIL
jgi:hypothetical protein